MAFYMIRRLVQAVLILLGVSFITFLLFVSYWIPAKYNMVRFNNFSIFK